MRSETRKSKNVFQESSLILSIRICLELSPKVVQVISLVIKWLVMIRKSRNYTRKKALEDSQVVSPQNFEVGVAVPLSVSRNIAASKQPDMARVMYLKNKYLGLADPNSQQIPLAEIQGNREMSIFYFDRLNNESERLKLRLQKSLDKYMKSKETTINRSRFVDKAGCDEQPPQRKSGAVRRSRSVLSEAPVKVQPSAPNTVRQDEDPRKARRKSLQSQLKQQVLNKMESLKLNLLQLIDQKFSM